MTMTGCTNVSNLKKECIKKLELNFGNQSSSKLRSLLNEPTKTFNKTATILKKTLR